MSNDDDFDFSGFPKLGRPYTGGSPRVKYLKFYMTENELLEYRNLEKKLKKVYEDMGYSYNSPIHFRLLLKNLNDPIILKILFSNLTDEFKLMKRK